MNEIITGIVIGIIICYWNIFLISHIIILYKKVNMGPNMDEIAKNLLTMKMPIEDLPDELKQEAQEMYNNQLKKEKNNRGSYIG
jgi:hypothetical protein